MPSGVADGSVHFGHTFLGELKPWHFPSTAIVAENLPLPFASARMSKRCPGKNRAPLGGVIVTTGSAVAAPATNRAASMLRASTFIVSPPLESWPGSARVRHLPCAPERAVQHRLRAQLRKQEARTNRRVCFGPLAHAFEQRFAGLARSAAEDDSLRVEE